MERRKSALQFSSGIWRFGPPLGPRAKVLAAVTMHCGRRDRAGPRLFRPRSCHSQRPTDSESLRELPSFYTLGLNFEPGRLTNLTLIRLRLSKENIRVSVRRRRNASERGSLR